MRPSVWRWYRGLGAHKNVLDLCVQGLKLAGDDKAHLAQMHKLRGVALVARADKPNDKKLQEAETVFRTALAANACRRPAEPGDRIVEEGRDGREFVS